MLFMGFHAFLNGLKSGKLQCQPMMSMSFFLNHCCTFLISDVLEHHQVEMAANVDRPEGKQMVFQYTIEVSFCMVTFFGR